jgi:hypothetical protein
MHAHSEIQKANDIAERLAGSAEAIQLTHVFRAVRECRPHDVLAAAELLESVYQYAVSEGCAEWALRAQAFE